jgi:hypothetical protein
MLVLRQKAIAASSAAMKDKPATCVCVAFLAAQDVQRATAADLVLVEMTSDQIRHNPKLPLEQGASLALLSSSLLERSKIGCGRVYTVSHSKSLVKPKRW